MHSGPLITKHFDRYETDVKCSYALSFCRISLYGKWSKHLNVTSIRIFHFFFTECHVNTTQMAIRITLCLIFAKLRSRFSCNMFYVRVLLRSNYKRHLITWCNSTRMLFFFLLIKLHRLKRRLRRNASNVDGMPSSSSSRRRYSVDSLERLVEDRLRNRPPPYTPDQDKPPSYEDSFQDPSSRHPSPTPVSAEFWPFYQLVCSDERQMKACTRMAVLRRWTLDWLEYSTFRTIPNDQHSTSLIYQVQESLSSQRTQPDCNILIFISHFSIVATSE